MTKTVAVLGSTGSIGRQTLQVVQELGLTVAALTANRQVDLLEQQARQFHPKLAVLYDRTASGRRSTNTASAAPRLRASMPSWPVPAKRSSTRRPSMSNWMMENRLSLTLSVVGRVSIPCSSLSRRPLAVPVMTRMAYTSGSKHSKMTRFPACSAASISSFARMVQLTSCT